MKIEEAVILEAFLVSLTSLVKEGVQTTKSSKYAKQFRHQKSRYSYAKKIDFK
ncbi:hypothetical protein V7266_29140 [Neobacillus drentensis]|uniref:hypothetical protein n=1 Tax=Neobacillus drentensis TaxID=220684 RepID=UPI0030002D99